jgi:hypothetical protein
MALEDTELDGSHCPGGSCEKTAASLVDVTGHVNLTECEAPGRSLPDRAAPHAGALWNQMDLRNGLNAV